jgi:hypothetical protein
MEQQSHIITEQVFGSSRRVQFIGLSKPSPMDSLLSAIDHAQPIRLPRPSDRLKDATQQDQQQQHQTMSIESLIDSNVNGTQHSYYSHPRQTGANQDISFSSLITSDNLKRKWTKEDVDPSKSSRRRLVAHAPSPLSDTKNDRHKTTITCLHASVAQKSYGSEKRFLCPPPIVHIQSSSNCTMTPEKRSEKMLLSMSVMDDKGEKILEQRSLLDENQSGSFKYLHVTGTAKAKLFSLNVNLLANNSNVPVSPSSSSNSTPPPSSAPHVLASFTSKPISIISKPSKKTAKTRNVSTCILSSSPVSLFNRINSQTVRTKYMTSCNDMLCAKNTTWSPFDIIVVNQPKQPINTTSTSNSRSNRPAPPQDHSKGPAVHITYGTEIILRDSQTGVSSPSLIIRKVDKGRIAPCAYGPVSQMQKIALQLASSIDSQPVYLSAAGNISESTLSSSLNSDHLSGSGNSSSNTWLDYTPSRIAQPTPGSMELCQEEVDDYLCWTIVGIAKFEYDYYENDDEEQQIMQQQQKNNNILEESTTTPPPSPPQQQPARCISPFPILSSVRYDTNNHTLDVVGHHLMQAAPVPRLLDLWLGTHGPLNTRISSSTKQLNETHWTVDLPCTQDLLVSNHDLLVTHSDGRRSLELALLLVRQDGVVYHSGKALSCDVLNDAGRWTVIAATSA